MAENALFLLYRIIPRFSQNAACVHNYS